MKKNLIKVVAVVGIAAGLTLVGSAPASAARKPTGFSWDASRWADSSWDASRWAASRWAGQGWS